MMPVIVKALLFLLKAHDVAEAQKEEHAGLISDLEKLGAEALGGVETAVGAKASQSTAPTAATNGGKK